MQWQDTQLPHSRCGSHCARQAEVSSPRLALGCKHWAASADLATDARTCVASDANGCTAEEALWTRDAYGLRFRMDIFRRLTCWSKVECFGSYSLGSLYGGTENAEKQAIDLKTTSMHILVATPARYAVDYDLDD